MCFVFIWEQTATCATYSINWLVFIAEMKSVYSAVRTGDLNQTDTVSFLKGSTWLSECYCSQTFLLAVTNQSVPNLKTVHYWAHNWVNKRTTKVAPVHSKKARVGSGDILPLILKFGTRGLGVLNGRARPLYFRQTIVVLIGGTERRSADFSVLL
jgi:hypothetical protein